MLAQRLVRRICDDCRATYQPATEQVALVSGRPTSERLLTHGVGCESCRGTGYRGRVGLFELLLMNDEIKDAITRGMRRAELTRLAEAGGMRRLRTDGWQKVVAGVTTVEEVARVAID